LLYNSIRNNTKMVVHNANTFTAHPPLARDRESARKRQ